jgi:hypothetical protein
MDKSVQQMMDERMCRPGYRWNDTLKRCLAAGGVGNGEGIGDLPDADVEPKPGEKPGVPAQPAKGGRGDVRVNANGITQMGTGMGKSVPVK